MNLRYPELTPRKKGEVGGVKQKTAEKRQNLKLNRERRTAEGNPLIRIRKEVEQKGEVAILNQRKKEEKNV